MRRPIRERTPAVGSGSPEHGGPLADLERLLRRQVELVRAGELEKADSLIAEADELLRQAAATAAPGRTLPDPQRIRGLYHELCLTLAARKGELADRLRRVAVGKVSLRAYGRAAGTR